MMIARICRIGFGGAIVAAASLLAAADVRLAGNDQMQAVVQRWAAGFRQQNPETGLSATFAGSDVAMAALYTGQCDIALLGRDATAPEVKAFEWIFRYRPMRIELMTGALDQPGKSPAVVGFVHADNPLQKITFAQLDDIISAERLRGGHEAITTWGGLGLTGGWAARPVHILMLD